MESEVLLKREREKKMKTEVWRGGGSKGARKKGGREGRGDCTE